MLVPRRGQRVEHEACPEAAGGVDGAVVAAVEMGLVGGDFGGGPHALDPVVFAGGFVRDAVAVFAGEDEVGWVIFDIRGAASIGQYFWDGEQGW